MAITAEDYVVAKEPLSQTRPKRAPRKSPVKSKDHPKKRAPKPTAPPKPPVPFNILIVAQAGPLQYQALLFAATLRHNAPDWKGRLIVAVPRAEGAWAGHDTALAPAVEQALRDLGAELTPFTATSFGASYPQGNKIEALATLPPDAPFFFFDSDTVITGPIDRLDVDFNRPSASMRRSNTWPDPPLYGPGYGDIWASLYERFGLDFQSSLDLSQPDEHWERYLYFNAGWFYGADPVEFGRRYLEWARQVRDEPGDALACQVLEPWLDQIILPLVIHSFNGGRPGPELDGLDGSTTWHYRRLASLYALAPDETLDRIEAAAAPNKVKKVLRDWQAAKLVIYRGKGRSKARAFYGQELSEKALRKQLKNIGLWDIPG